jgi:integrase/recombinase XerC
MSKAALLEQWGEHLARSRRRSPHTVRVYLAAANRLAERVGAEDWLDIAGLDSIALRTQLAARRADGLGNVSAARELSALKTPPASPTGSPRSRATTGSARATGRCCC